MHDLEKMTKLERDMEVAALNAKHDAELLQVRGEETSEIRCVAGNER